MLFPKFRNEQKKNDSANGQFDTLPTTSTEPEILVPTDFHFTDDRKEVQAEDVLTEGLAIINGERLGNDKKKKKEFKLPVKTIKLVVAIILVIVFILLLVKTLNDYGILPLF